MGSDYTEPAGELSTEAREIHRALTSLIEELEAVDYYHQRMDVCSDASLKGFCSTTGTRKWNTAAMALEWLRRKLPIFDKELKDNLFKDGEIGHHA